MRHGGFVLGTPYPRHVTQGRVISEKPALKLIDAQESHKRLPDHQRSSKQLFMHINPSIVVGNRSECVVRLNSEAMSPRPQSDRQGRVLSRTTSLKSAPDTTLDDNSPSGLDFNLEDFYSYDDDFERPDFGVEPKDSPSSYRNISVSNYNNDIPGSIEDAPYILCHSQLYGATDCACWKCLLSGPTEVNERNNLTFTTPDNLLSETPIRSAISDLSTTNNTTYQFVSLEDIENWPADDCNRRNLSTDYHHGFLHEADPYTTPASFVEVFPRNPTTFGPHEGNLMTLAPPDLEQGETIRSRYSAVDSKLESHAQTRATRQFEDGSIQRSKRTNPVIKKWFLAHMTWPYPNPQEERALEEESGLELRRVRRCLTNLRARTRKRG